MLCLIIGSVQAQNIGINETGAIPDPSAMLDISSPDKGFLTPRLPDHTAIAAPATGLLVFNTTTSTFWFYNGTIWIEITFPVSKIIDNDLDTWVDVEITPDDDIIRFAAQSATDQMRFDGHTLHWTSSSIYIGEQSGGAATGTNNTYLGFQTAPLTTTGSDNLIIGSMAGNALAAGSNNTLLGTQTAELMGSGSFNVLIGKEAGYNMTAGSEHVMIGYRSGFNQTDNAVQNTFVGFEAGFNNTTANFNTMVGYEAGRSTTEGGGNTYLGHSAGLRNVTGIHNVAIGRSAASEGDFSIGKDNVYVGAFAGRYSTANANVMVGFGAGEYNKTSFNNTFVGYRAGQGYNNVNNPGSENAFFGHQAGRDCDGCIRSTAIGQNAGVQLRSGIYNTFLGARAGFGIISGSGNVFLGHRAGEFMSSGTSNRLIIANTHLVEDVLIYGEFDNERIGINTTTPDATLTVDGTASNAGGGPWLTFSDQRVKKDIGEFSDGLNVVMQLEPVTFQYNNLSGYSVLNKRFVGFLAQDVEQVAPYMVSLYDDSEGASGLADKRVFDETALSKILVNAIQEQQQHIESLEERIERLEQLLLQSERAPKEAVAEKK